MSIKLRELIRNIRTCKTAAEERAVIAKECAAIRTSFREEDPQHRHRNVAKLLFINMLGYPTNFGQMECLKLIASGSFPEKRIGYLGLTQLLDENTEVLMLVTNSIKNDLQHNNQFIVGLGVVALGNVGTPEMCAVLFKEIVTLLGDPNPYLRKKAALCAMRVVRKTEHKLDEFCSRVRPCLEDRNHSVVLCGIQLLTSILRENPERTPEFRDVVPSLARLLQNLLRGSYAAGSEYDIGPFTDPFLQCAIIRLLRYLGHRNAVASEQMNEVLATVATNTDSTRNIGNAILYETVQTIFGIEAESGLRTLAITVLGKLLGSRDNNIRYVALATLQKVVKVDLRSVQKHRQTILECLKDPDISLQRRALGVIYALIDEHTVKMMIKELLNFLLVADSEVKEELVLKICQIIDRWGPDRRWQIDQLVKVMCLSGNFVTEETRNYFCLIVGSSPPLHAYTAHKMYFSMRHWQNWSQEALILCGIWCIGEYGDHLINGKADGHDGQAIKIWSTEVLQLLEQISMSPEYNGESGFSGVRKKTLVLEYLVTSLIKLVPKMPNEVHKIRDMLKRYESHISPELQQRSCEYQELLAPAWNADRAEILARVPPMEARLGKQDVGSSAIEEVSKSVRGPGQQNGGVLGTGGGADLMDDLLGLGGPATTSGATPAAGNSGEAGDLLDLLVGAPVAPTTAPSTGEVDLLDLLGAASPVAPTTFQKGNLTIEFSCSRNEQDLHVCAEFHNYEKSMPLTDFTLQVAVPKTLSLKMDPIQNGNVLQPNDAGNVWQKFTISNLSSISPPREELMIRLRITYKLAGEPQTIQSQQTLAIGDRA